MNNSKEPEKRSTLPLLIGCFFGGLLFMVLIILLIWLTRRRNRRLKILAQIKSREKHKSLQQMNHDTFEYCLDMSPMLQPLSSFTSMNYSQSHIAQLTHVRTSNRSSMRFAFEHTTNSNRSSTLSNKPYSFYLPQAPCVPQVNNRHLSLPPMEFHDSAAFAYLNGLDQEATSHSMIKSKSTTCIPPIKEEIRSSVILMPIHWPLPATTAAGIVEKHSNPASIVSDNMYRTDTFSESSLRQDYDAWTSLIKMDDFGQPNFVRKPRPVSCGPYLESGKIIPSPLSSISGKNASVGHEGGRLEDIQSESSKTNLLLPKDSSHNNVKVRVRSLSLKKIRRTTFKSIEGIEVLPKLIRDRSTGSIANSSSNSSKRVQKNSDPIQIQQFQSVSLSSTFKSKNPQIVVEDHSHPHQQKLNEEEEGGNRRHSHNQLSPPLWSEKSAKATRRPSDLTINSLTGEVRSPLHSRTSPSVSTDFTLSSTLDNQRMNSSFDSDGVVNGHEM